MQHPIKLVALAAIVLLQGGCISANLTRNVTTGQELIDLQKAHAAGALTDSEYVALKSRMVSEAAGGSSESPSGSAKP
jgi:hypothetical protein